MLHFIYNLQESNSIQGNPASNPFDRRASRRLLLHCDAISVSCLDFDDAAEVQSAYLPDNSCARAERRNHFEFVDGSFLGRSELFENPHTRTAHREIKTTEPQMAFRDGLRIITTSGCWSSMTMCIREGHGHDPSTMGIRRVCTTCRPILTAATWDVPRSVQCSIGTIKKWLDNKAIYRTRMAAMADGGTLIVLAPGVDRFEEDDRVDALMRTAECRELLCYCHIVECYCTIRTVCKIQR